MDRPYNQRASIGTWLGSLYGTRQRGNDGLYNLGGCEILIIFSLEKAQKAYGHRASARFRSHRPRSPVIYQSKNGVAVLK